MEGSKIPTINPIVVPTKAPGTLFTALTGGDQTLNIRWLTATDPAFYEVLNRPLADITVRQLVVAKAVDNLQYRLGSQTLFPFIIQPKVSSGTLQTDVPIGWIWDLTISLPSKWENVRLARLFRDGGVNSSTEGYTGAIKALFTANIVNSVTETFILIAEYIIQSDQTYQVVKLEAATDDEAPGQAINPNESQTVTGFITFRTLNTDLEVNRLFFDLLAPSDVTTGTMLIPEIYDIVDSPGASTTIVDDFSPIPISHGTGMLTESAYTLIPQLDTSVDTWLGTFNYPFDSSVTRMSSDGVVVPKNLFKEFNIVAPAGDQPTGDTSGLNYVVWLSKVELVGASLNIMRFYFSTYNITDDDPETTPVEFGILDIPRESNYNEILEIHTTGNLLLETGTDSSLFNQQFGRGHVSLASIWNSPTTIVDDFFSSLTLLPISNRNATVFSQSAARISSYGISRISKYSPTKGQSNALRGSTAVGTTGLHKYRTNPINPSDSNRFVSEADQGEGIQIDLEGFSGVTPIPAIERYGYTGSLTHRVVRLIVNTTELGNDQNIYVNQIEPRLKILLGRDPIFGDFWYNGTRLFFYNGDTWVG